MQQSGGLLLAAGLDGGNTLIFAKGENANESLPVYVAQRAATIPQSACSADSSLYTREPLAAQIFHPVKLFR